MTSKIPRRAMSVTPFNPQALLAMLLAFYPECSPANLARAWRERPEYFAGGVIIGNKGDALRLPSGEVWDLIFDVDNPSTRHWQAIRPGGGGGGDEDPFALDPGPVDFLEPDEFPPPRFERTFETLVANGTRALSGGDNAAAGAVDIIASAASDDGLNAETEAAIGGAALETDAQLASWHVVDPSDVLASAGELADVTYIREGEIADPAGAPGDAPSTDPGPPPRDDEDRNREPEV